MTTIMPNLPKNIGQHKSVMLAEAVAALAIKPGGTYVDGTFGCGGHTELILNKLGDQGKLLVIDLDLDAIKLARNLQQQDPRIIYYHGSFKDLELICNTFAIDSIDGILLDLGVSSPQLDNPNKGFSFTKDGPLDMRMNSTTGITAEEWLQKVEFNELCRVLKQYGQEKFFKKIATAVIEFREKYPIKTTAGLVKIIQQVYPKSNHPKKHPATRTFQAIRIEINQELSTLEQSLPKIIKLLARGGRLVVISFHSLEDSIVKNFITKHSKLIIDPALRKFPEIGKTGQLINLKNFGKFKPTAQEIIDNPRARSAIMRVAEKCK